MLSVHRIAIAAAALVALFDVSPVAAVEPFCANFAPALVMRGRKFFNSITREYVPIKGVSYYPRPNVGDLAEISNSVDFFEEAFKSKWTEDIALFKRLNINAVRLYGVNPGKNHDSFMCALKAAGIWAIVGLAADCEGCAITRDAAPMCYPAELKTRGQLIISQFAKYDNVLAFSAGNEVGLVAPLGKPEHNAPCQKRFVRDMRRYIRSCLLMRSIPVGLVIADIDREDKAMYYNCRTDPDDVLENAEFIGINAYLHCDGTKTDPLDLPGYQQLLDEYTQLDLTIPVILTEFGCLNPSFPTINGFAAQRDFLQVDTLFHPQYADEFAGAFVFEYSAEAVNINNDRWPFNRFDEGNYGIGFFSPEDCNDIDIKCTYNPYPQFDSLSARFDDVTNAGQPTFDTYEVGERILPNCPAAYANVTVFDWPADTIDNWECPEPVAIYCDEINPECTRLPGIDILPTPPPGEFEKSGVEPDVTVDVTVDADGNIIVNSSASMSGAFSLLVTIATAWMLTWAV